LFGITIMSFSPLPSSPDEERTTTAE